MKTLCVAALVLSLSSVCQPASLACEKLLQPVDKAPDKRSYQRGICTRRKRSKEIVVRDKTETRVNRTTTQLMKTQPTRKSATARLTIRSLSSVCQPALLALREAAAASGQGSRYSPHGEPAVLLQSGCPDCVVLKQDDPHVAYLLLFSKKNNK
ncbi:hypothetical protein NQZ68_003438 [Dissostichus eleginoides]|nr:hypothetical protein NQZ68_003438 [Dissostichus eleginoides]